MSCGVDFKQSLSLCMVNPSACIQYLQDRVRKPSRTTCGHPDRCDPRGADVTVFLRRSFFSRAFLSINGNVRRSSPFDLQFKDKLKESKGSVRRESRMGRRFPGSIETRVHVESEIDVFVR